VATTKAGVLLDAARRYLFSANAFSLAFQEKFTGEYDDVLVYTVRHLRSAHVYPSAELSSGLVA
jgi:hypothetical protein